MQEQYVQVQTPLSIGANAQIGDTKVQCYGDPEITITFGCNGCRALVVQRLRLCIPIDYVADVSTDPSTTLCISDTTE